MVRVRGPGVATQEPQRTGSGIGHEFRSQLTLIKGYAQFVVRLLRRDDVPRDTILPHAERVASEITRLEALSDELLQQQPDDRQTSTSGSSGDGDAQ
jgi:signal transduction histidine kinase